MTASQRHDRTRDGSAARKIQDIPNSMFHLQCV
jgi:hypothetical protein